MTYLNFELPALARDGGAKMRSCYEYVSFPGGISGSLPNLTMAYPEETAVTSRSRTWWDNFPWQLAGVYVHGK